MPKKKYDGPSPEEVLVQNLIALMETDQSPWRKSWTAGSCVHKNLFTNHKYRGSNIILLEFGSALGGYSYPYWCGFDQARKHGLKVIKGSVSTRIFQPIQVTGEKELDDGQVEQYAFTRFKVVPVFNVDNLEGERKQEFLDKQLEQVEVKNLHDRIETADHILNSWPVEIRHGLVNPCYVPAIDVIRMPELNRFDSAEEYYATKIHEMIHSTGHSSRLNRDQKGAFGSHSYAKEELVAELGAVLLCNRLEIGTQFQSHAAYLKSWIEVLKEEPKFLFQALSQANKAADLIYKPNEQLQESGTNE